MSAAVCQYFDLPKLDRSILKHTSYLEVILPHRFKPTVPKGSMAHWIVTMCQHAGISISVNDVTNHRVTRQIGSGANRRIGRAPIKQFALKRIYEALYNGKTPDEFLEMLKKRGWIPRPRPPVFRPRQLRRFRPKPRGVQQQLFG